MASGFNVLNETKGRNGMRIHSTDIRFATPLRSLFIAADRVEAGRCLKKNLTLAPKIWSGNIDGTNIARFSPQS